MVKFNWLKLRTGENYNLGYPVRSGTDEEVWAKFVFTEKGRNFFYQEDSRGGRILEYSCEEPPEIQQVIEGNTIRLKISSRFEGELNLPRKLAAIKRYLDHVNRVNPAQ